MVTYSDWSLALVDSSFLNTNFSTPSTAQSWNTYCSIWLTDLPMANGVPFHWFLSNLRTFRELLRFFYTLTHFTEQLIGFSIRQTHTVLSCVQHIWFHLLLETNIRMDAVVKWNYVPLLLRNSDDRLILHLLLSLSL